MKYLQSYVYDKSTDTLIECGFGGHYEAIRTILANVFNTRKSRLYWDFQKESDDYIAENIIIKGQYQHKDYYKVGKQMY